ncbi:hypothetical protein QM012_008742 [Aureobasidium pullulans]|uniref:Uncharacterized protein n=1 Tax=Aureobasidium pullulans TaxID=5580 RepID=A0ABR0TID3_AURPU
MHCNSITILLSVLTITISTSPVLAKPCNAAFAAVCEDGSTETPLNVGSVNGCLDNVCSGSRRGIKHLYGITDGDNCNSFTAYGSTDCSPSYSSTTTQCNRGQAGMTSENAQ